MKSNNQINDYFIITMIISVLVSANLVSLSYANVYQEIGDFFNVSKEKIILIPRANFVGLAFGSILSGIFCNLFNKKTILLYGLLLLTIGSFIASNTNNFLLFTLSFLIMGLAKSSCLVLTSTIILDRYKKIKEANKIMLLVRIILLVSLACLPILLLRLSSLFHWRIFFFSILFFSIVALIMVKLLLKTEESKILKNKCIIKDTFKEYLMILKNPIFLCNTLIYSFPAILISLYLNSISLTLIGHAFTTESYTIRASLLLVFNFIFSALSIYITNKKGLNFNQNLGFIIVIIAAFRLVHLGNAHEELLFFPLYLCTAGMAMMNGFFIKASMVIPEKKAQAIALITMITSIFSARMMHWSEIFYDKTIKPTLHITVGLTFVILIIFFILKRIEAKNKDNNSEIK